MSDMETRQQLLAAAEGHEQDLERALVDLERAVWRPFAAVDRVGQHIADRPLPWLFASLLVGLWFGTRRTGSE